MFNSKNTANSMIPNLRGSSSQSLSKKKKQEIQIDTVVNGGASNQKVQCFSFWLQQSVEGNPTAAWTYQIPVLSPNQKQLFLVTEGFTTILQDFVGDDFPQTINIGLDGYAGYIGFKGLPTPIVIVLRLVDINTVNNEGMITRDLIYRNQVKANWSLGLSRDITFRIYLDESTQPVTFPLQNPVGVIFKIIHLAY